MNYDWYIKYNKLCTEDVKNTVNRNVEILMDYFFNKLEKTEDYSIEAMNKVFKTIIEEMGCMKCNFCSGESLIIQYNRSVDIIIENSKTQIYRNLKLQKILK